jgi:lysophospholipase L1-like esterase
VTDTICPKGVCTPLIDGILVRYDGTHFSAQGAEWVAPAIYRQLVKVQAIH